jgi:nitroimidazol reductase NimA-like FMN-containing flavoprotein (pyridoxamine 5'-phosphate oxidase superfamily)
VIDLETSECLRVLDEGYVAHIGVLSAGVPYVTPMSYVMIDGTLYFRTGPGRRVDALREEPICCVEVTILREDDAWESVLFWGEARFIDEPNHRSDVVAALLSKYHTESPLGSSSPSFLPKEHPIVAIEPTEVTGRASGIALGRQTRPGRL